MRSTALVTLLTLTLAGCFEEEEKTYDKNELAQALAEAECDWIFACCDSAEQDTKLGSGTSQSACVSSARSKYADLFRDADPEKWSGSAAAACLGTVRSAAESCPRAFDPVMEIDKCEMVAPDKKPGDLCQTSWDCTTKFCRSGTCANPLPDGSQCAPGDVCQTGLKCVNSTCVGLQPDGAACTVGDECYSGACGAGKCIASAKYTCDGA
jgi:hypothetical protein